METGNSRHGQCFFGTLEQCLELYGGESLFKVSPPVTFFSGARLETHRRAESNDGNLLIIERQLGPTSCEVYSRSGLPAVARVQPHSDHSSRLSQSNCA